MSETTTPVDVLVHYKSGGTPTYLHGVEAGEAEALRDALTTHVTADWLDYTHKGAQHRILAADVNQVSIRPAYRAREDQGAAEPPIPTGVDTYGATGADPQIPAGTPVSADGTPLDDEGYGMFT